MHLDPLERRAELSVRELASFRNLPEVEAIPGGGLWRAQVGQQWHELARSQIEQSEPEARFELSQQATLRIQDWSVQISGRIDQLLPQANNQWTVRELKTIQIPLPQAEADLRQRYPDYFAQTAIYTELLRQDPEFADAILHAEIQFIDITDGTVQIVQLDQSDHERCSEQLNRLLPFLNDRRDARLRLQDIQTTPAFETLRDGQAELITSLHKASLGAQTVLLEAPTGFGKTGIVLQHVLEQMQSGLFERCIYLSSKSTGQLQTLQQLQRMIGQQLRFIQMRNREEHRIDSPKHRCTGDTHCDDQLAEHWFGSDLHAPELFDDGTLTIERAKELGAATGVCPYSLSRACLPFAEFWIGDLNYIFSPSSQTVFNSPYGFNPAKTLLIVDEAHNLPDRVADNLSIDFKVSDWLFALEELRAAGASRRLTNTGEDLIHCIDNSTTGVCSQATLYEFMDASEEFNRILQQERLNYSAIAPFALEQIWQFPALIRSLNASADRYLYWIPNNGHFRATCLDPSQWIHDCIQPFGAAVLMSATLSPIAKYQSDCGLATTKTTVSIGHAEWREQAYDIAIDARVDTRLKHRADHYATTAETVAQLCTHSFGVPIAVFFPSYQYAENIRTYLEAIAPELRIRIQPRGVELAEQERFIEETLLTTDALFLILGSSYAEGVDALGGRIDTAMVVGPALPEVNPVQDAKMNAYGSQQRADAFRDVYIIPAMRRIHQALGRLVRAPEHRARVLLHCKRYTTAPYFEQLAPEYQSTLQIRNQEALLNWLANSKD